jgi:putative transposase
VYPVVFIDCIHVKIRDGHVANRPIYMAIAVTTEGNRDILGLWAGDGGEGAKHWMQVLTEIKNRGVRDVLMLVCDGLTGLPDAVNAVWPDTIVQTCVVHLLRNSFKYAARQDWDKIAKALKPIYTAATEEAAMERFLEFERDWGRKYPAIIGLWNRAWVPFLQFDVEIRKIVCTTNAIVIWSRPKGVLHVVQEAVSPGGLRDGCGYLPPSMTQIFRRNSAGPACAPVRLAA